jgi:UDP-hydrolysing UDP-N-acetyl-D-glucosamine 2-epimerase
MTTPGPKSSTPTTKRKIAVVTTSRADYSHLYWPLRDLAAHPDVDLKLIVLAAHLSPSFGSTVDEIERDGLPIAARIECLLSSDSDVGMAKTLGLAALGLADTLAQMRPDLLLLIADRYEMLAPASVALTLRIPIAHIEGGEISEGAIDDQVRNAITKMAHLHFTSTPTARARVITMGEEPWRVLRAGAPSLDHLRRSTLLTRPQLEAALNLTLADRSTGQITVVAYHPVTLLADTTAEADAVFAALEAHADHASQSSTQPSTQTPPQILFCYPNADAGSHALMTRVRAFCAAHANAHLFVNLPAIIYWSLLREATLLLGNSSSGIMEAASFALPVVNIGLRQFGRERAANILDAPDPASPDAASPDPASPDSAFPDSAFPDSASPDSAFPDSAFPDSASPDSASLESGSPDAGSPDADAAATADAVPTAPESNLLPTAAAILAQIARAQSPGFRDSLRTLENPYGDGHAAERIVARILEVLTTTPREDLLRKRAQPIDLPASVPPLSLPSVP